MKRNQNYTLKLLAPGGALLLTDSRANGIEQLFDLGHEVIVYDSDSDLLDKVNYYRAHDAERQQIAEAGQQRCLRDHTFIRRAEQLVGYLNGPIVQCAPMRSASAKERRALRRFGLDLCLGHMVGTEDAEPVYAGRLGLKDGALRELAGEAVFAALENAGLETATRPFPLFSVEGYPERSNR